MAAAKNTTLQDIPSHLMQAKIIPHLNNTDTVMLRSVNKSMKQSTQTRTSNMYTILEKILMLPLQGLNKKQNAEIIEVRVACKRDGTEIPEALFVYYYNDFRSSQGIFYEWPKYTIKRDVPRKNKLQLSNFMTFIEQLKRNDLLRNGRLEDLTVVFSIVYKSKGVRQYIYIQCPIIYKNNKWDKHPTTCTFLPANKDAVDVNPKFLSDFNKACAELVDILREAPFAKPTLTTTAAAAQTQTRPKMAGVLNHKQAVNTFLTNKKPKPKGVQITKILRER